MTTWIKDSHGNRCSVEFYRSSEHAQAALDSLEDCLDCTNCSDCVGCISCLSCYFCSHCTNCANCSHCYNCNGCMDCSSCSKLADFLIATNNRRKPQFDDSPSIPKIANIHKCIYEAVSKPGSLDMASWHHCETTHCRGGWAVHLAGEPGRALEIFHGTLLAAQLIYRESGAPISPCRFYDSDEEAMADMKKLAEVT